MPNTKTAEQSTAEQYIERFRQSLDGISKSSQGILNAPREEAMKHFIAGGFPGKKHENYLYTDVRALFAEDMKQLLDRPKIEIALDEVFRCDVPDLDTNVLMLINGWFHGEEPLSTLPGGAIVGSLQAAAEKYPEIVGKHYNQYTDTKTESLAALNTAFAQDGFFLYLPKNTHFKKPLQIINILLGEEDIFVQPRNLIVVEEGAGGKLVMCEHTLSAQRFLSNALTEVHVAANAHMEYYAVQNQHNGASHLSTIYVQQERDSRMDTNLITLHGGTIRNNLYVKLNGENGENNSQGLFLADRGQHIDNYVRMEHARPNCRSNQLFKGILDDWSTGGFSGQVLVQKDAQKTEAFQSNNNILLTDDAKMNTKPQLIINADDVKCSHGATVGQLDEKAMFYLRARGIPEKEARLLLMYAFADEVIRNIRIEALRERYTGLVDQRLRGELSRCNNCEYNCH